jgi:hypothetical protein
MIAQRFILSFAVFIIAFSNLQAHALWIHTAESGSTGKVQSIKVTYAEPGEQPEKVSEWYSDVREFELWLTAPDGKREKLVTVAGEDHFNSEFTPEKEGIYTLSVGHSARELGGKTVYQFNASALVRVGNPTVGNLAAVNKNELSVFADVSKTSKVNKPLKINTFYKGAPGEKVTVSVFSPSGWSKQIVANENGEAEFTPIWPGAYYIEGSKSLKENGTHGDKEYDSIWRAATLLVTVVK